MKLSENDIKLWGLGWKSISEWVEHYDYMSRFFVSKEELLKVKL